MDLHTVTRVRRPARAEEIASWEAGFAWLAGGTWLFSEPQVNVHTLIDLESLRWPSLQPSAEGLEIASTCKVVELDQFVDHAPSRLDGGPAFRHCCRSFLASFKIWNEATVGGNICHVAAGRPDDFAHGRARRALHRSGRGTVEPRQVPVVDFVTGNHQNVLAARRIAALDLPARARARKKFAFRRFTLTHLGRSEALLDRHPLPGARRTPADDHRRHAAPDSAPL